MAEIFLNLIKNINQYNTPKKNLNKIQPRITEREPHLCTWQSYCKKNKENLKSHKKKKMIHHMQGKCNEINT